MFYLSGSWICCVYSREISIEVLCCDWNEAERTDECLEAERGDVRHITIQLSRHHTPLHRLLTSHSISPSGATSISMSFCPSSFSSKLWSVCMSSTVVWFKGAPVVLWKQRGLLLFQQMLVRLKCADCSAVFLMLNLCSGKHLITHTSTVCCCISQPCHQWFYCCCLFDSLHKRNYDRFKYFFHIDVYNKGLKAHLKEKKCLSNICIIL